MPAEPTPLKRCKILVTGPTSQVAFPIVRHLARDNEVVGLARFRDDAQRRRVEAVGASTIAVDLSTGRLDEIPRDFDYVLHFAVVKSGDFDYDMRVNAEGVGFLMAHCRDVRGFLHCSTAGVYHDGVRKPLSETDPLGDNHRVMMPTYSLCKIAAEAVVRTQAALFEIPTVIARLSVPYGDNGGWPYYHLLMMKAGAPIPVHVDGPSRYNLLHEDDYIEMIPRLLARASTPATVINWGGSEPTSIEEWTAWIGELTGLEPKLAPTTQTLRSVELDPTRMHALVGRTRVPWKEGIERMVAALAPDLAKRAP